MRIIVLSMFMLAASCVCLQAQEMHLNAYTGYVFDDQFETFNSNTSFYNGTILGGFQWGVGLEYKPVEYYGVEILYYRQDTDVPVNYYSLLDISRTLKASVNYIMLAGNRYFSSSDRVEGYVGPMAGVVIYDNKEPEPGEPNSATKFGWGFRLGGNIWATDQVGIKIQMQVLSAVQAVGGSFYVGTGGTGAGLSGYSTLFQFVLGGGLVFRFE